MLFLRACQQVFATDTSLCDICDMNSVQSWFNVGLMLNALERPSLLKDLEVQLMIGDDQGLRSTTSILRGFQKFTNVCRIFNLPGSIVDLRYCKVVQKSPSRKLAEFVRRCWFAFHNSGITAIERFTSR